MGYLRLSDEQWGEMRLGTFFLKLDYYFREKQEQYKFFGNIIRLQTQLLLNIQLDSKSKIRNPEELWRFNWDVDKKSIQDSSKTAVKEKVNSLLDTLNKVINGKS